MAETPPAHQAGDPRLIPRATHDLIAIELRPPGGEGDAAEGHKTARNWARTYLANPNGWVNETTGWKVKVQTSGMDEAIHRLRWPHGLARQTLAAIPEFLRVAVPVQTEPDQEGRPDIHQVHTLIAPLELAGVVHRARMVIREMEGTGTTHYGHHLEGLDIRMPGAGGVGESSASMIGLGETVDSRGNAATHFIGILGSPGKSSVILTDYKSCRRSGPPSRAAGSLDLKSASGPPDDRVVGPQRRFSNPT